MNPSTDDTYDLGVTGHEWRNLNIDGTANIDSLVADTADINGGTIDGTAIGAATASTGAFTTLSATVSSTTTSGTIRNTSTGTGAIGGFYFGNDSSATAGVIGVNSSTSVPGTGGVGGPLALQINNLTNNPVSIGVNNALVASFTSTGLNSTAIGATTPSTAVFTTLHQGTAGAQGLAVGFSGAAGQGFTLRDTTNSRTYFVTTETATGLQINAGANPISLLASSVAVTGALSATGNGLFAGAYGSVSVTSNTGTNGADVRFINTGGTYYVGVDSSTGNAFGATAYDMIHFLPTGRGLSTVISGSGVVTRVSSTGLAVTGALSAIASGGLKNTMTGSGTGLIQMGTTATEVGIRYDASTVIGCVTATESAYCSIKATAFTVSSDRRIKKNITDYTDSGTLIDSLRPRRFDINTTKPMHGDGKAGMIGLVAQEAYEIFPQAVTKGDENEEITAEWGVDYSQFIGPVLAELKSLRARVAALESN
jgi:hypothetical protein